MFLKRYCFVVGIIHAGLVLTAYSAGLRAAAAQGFAVASLVDSTMQRPDGGGKFYPVAPAIDRSTVVFNQGAQCAGCPAPDSIWAADRASGQLRKLVDTGTAVPGGSGTFSYFDSGAIVKNGTVLFLGFDSNSRPGLYAVPAAGGAVVRLADSKTAIPGASVSFTSFGHAGFHHDGSTAVFTASGAGINGIYSVKTDGSSLARVADSNTPVNSNTCNLFPVLTYSKPSISNGNLSFLGQTTFDYNAGFSALYTNPLSRASSATCAGPTPAAANSDQQLPGNPGTHMQTQFDYGRMDGTTLVFRAVESATGFGGIFSSKTGATSPGGALSSIVDVTTPLPEFGTVAYSGNFLYAVDAGNVVFYARDATGTKAGLFLAGGGAIAKIAGTGDVVDGVALQALDPLGAGAVQGQAVVYTGIRAGGSRALYVAAPAAGAFSVQTVTNAASGSAGAVSPGEIVTLIGSGMGPAGTVTSTPDSNGHLATQLAGVRVLFDGIPAPLVYVAAARSSAIVPYAVDGRPSVSVVVEYQGATTAPLSLQVSDSAPGIYSADGSGQGQSVILNQDQTMNSFSNPAAQGSVVSLFGTGEGQTIPSGVDGQVASLTLPSPRLPVSLTVGGKAVTEVLYQGAAPGEVAGLLQVSFRLPLGLASGNVSVTLQVGSASSQNGLTIAVQ